MKPIAPELYGLHKRVKLFKINKKTIVIQKNRKSRIIMKDGKKILEIAEQINKKESQTKIIFETNAPICSKTKTFLIERGVSINQNQ